MGKVGYGVRREWGLGKVRVVVRVTEPTFCVSLLKDSLAHTRITVGYYDQSVN